MRRCQANPDLAADVELPSQSPDGPYVLSHAAAERLKSLSLRPVEWFRLAVIHGPFEFYLHDDFYDDDGVACQAAQPVVDADLFPAPRLDKCRAHLRDLIDFAMTRWHLDQAAIEALHDWPADGVLDSLRQRAARTTNPWRRGRLFEIAGKALKRAAERWVRDELDAIASPAERITILYDAAACLPADEAYTRSTDALEELPPRERLEWCIVLAQFRDALALDWIEQHVAEPITSRWGDLAACSRLDWSRVVDWLARGRPLSLVALDALVACDSPRSGQSPVMRRIAPKLDGAPSEAEMAAILRRHAQIDPSPRVRKSVEHVLARLAFLCAR
jgi:hypothetical protein